MNPNPFVPRGPVYSSKEEKRSQERRNDVRQAQFVMYTAQNWGPNDRITPELLLELQRLAVNQIYRCAGHFRDDRVTLDGATHTPPPQQDVLGLVNEMCSYVNERWETTTPIHLSAYAMWRMNWIHPFFGGNGRSSRAVSYLVLCAKLGFALPGEKTIPEFIAEDRAPYYKALREADAAYEGGKIDVTAMENLIASLLAKQLVQVHKQAIGEK